MPNLNFTLPPDYRGIVCFVAVEPVHRLIKGPCDFHSKFEKITSFKKMPILISHLFKFAIKINQIDNDFCLRTRKQRTVKFTAHCSLDSQYKIDSSGHVYWYK